MCCNTKAGPRAALAFFTKKTGVHVTQADWHKIRKAAEVSLGYKLSNKVSDAHKAAEVAAIFADSLKATPEEKRGIIFELSNLKSTEGNVETVRELATNGLPKEVVNKTRRISVAQKLAAEQRDVVELTEERLVAIVEDGVKYNAGDDLYQVNISYGDGSPDNSYRVWAPTSMEASRYVSEFGSVVGMGYSGPEFVVGDVERLENAEVISEEEYEEFSEMVSEQGANDSDNLPDDYDEEVAV